MKTIAEVIAEHVYQCDDHRPRGPECCACGWETARAVQGSVEDRTCREQWPAHLAQAIREARTVRTVSELLALPHGTYIRAEGGVFPNGEVPADEWEGVLADCAPHIPLPVRVLWAPGDEA